MNGELPEAPAVVSKDEIMNVDEVATFLRVGRNAIYEAAARQAIPHRRIGRRLIFSRQVLIEWIAGGWKGGNK